MDIRDNVDQMYEDRTDSEDVLGVMVGALRKVRGYFVLSYDGDEYVVMAKRELDRMLSDQEERQLTFTEHGGLSEDYAEEDISRFNRDVASVRVEQDDDFIEENTRMWVGDKVSGEVGKRVRFEPIKGDLPPELQE